jgi:hypothetical protein
MLDPNKNYVSKEVDVFNTGLKEVDNKRFRILWQGKSDRDGLVFELNTRNPNAKKVEALCIKENQCKVL